jgi:carbohydrate kinase (thermoresistant glucokinase family)
MPAPAIVVMGVSGCGKSSVAAGLAAALGADWIDGDDLHSTESVAKMRAGNPLTDADRWPWLDRIGARLAEATQGERGMVIACSALKRAYRDRLRAAAPGLRFVFLDGSAELIAERLARRAGHYMPAGLLASQLQTLERPGAEEEDVVRLDVTDTLESLTAEALTRLRIASRE